MAALSSLEGSFDEKDKACRARRPRKLAVFDEAMLFLRGGIDALQDS